MKPFGFVLFGFVPVYLFFSTAGFAQSVYKLRPDDSKAVFLNTSKTDGKQDATEDIQQAINRVQEQGRFGIVFIPEGSYRISKPINVWKGIRLIGYGTKRPVFILGANTPGYAEGEQKYMLHFTSDRPRNEEAIQDANPGTFYSAISNIDFKIEKGNPTAICIRSHFAQHCFLAHIRFEIGEGKAAVEEVGNEIEDCRFIGGEYGISTKKPSPSWPFLLIDSYFEGQRKACIRTEEGGMTIVRVQFKNAACAIEINPDRAEELWMTDSRLENISGPAINISDEYNARPQINISNLVCKEVPSLAFFRQSEKKVVGKGLIYRVNDFCHGLQIDDLGAVPVIKTTFDIEELQSSPEPKPSDIPNIPDAATWVNIKLLGAIGDGSTDDTRVFKEAILKYKTIFLPSGRYKVSETILLEAKTILIGMSPISTQIILADSSPNFIGPGGPIALLETPKGGENIVMGIGLDAGGINPRAVAAKWMAGNKSYMNDVRFLGGHGTYNPDGSWMRIYNNNRTQDGNPNRRWDNQYWSLWITNGGGGTFKDIWTPSSFAQTGIYVSNTSTEGRLYATSIEHHVRNEVQFRNVSNWKIYDMQMEEESSEGWNALPLELINCSNITFANLYLYRVIRMVDSYPYGVYIQSSKNIEFRGVHVYSPTIYSFDNTIYDADSKTEIRSREIARLLVTGKPVIKPESNPHTVVAEGAKVEELATGFDFITGTVTDKAGNLYFVDNHWHKIYGWSEADKTVKKVCDFPVSPLALAFDRAGNLLVLAHEVVNGTWYSPVKPYMLAIDTKNAETSITVLEKINADSLKATDFWIPGHRWRDEHNFRDIAAKVPEEYFLSPDGSTAIPLSDDLQRTYTLKAGHKGETIYVADEFGQKTVAFYVNSDGTLTAPKLFCEEGELGIAIDLSGNVYVAAGNIFVYDTTGKQIDYIEVPERPSTIVFGGPDGKTLFIGARSSIYSLRVK